MDPGDAARNMQTGEGTGEIRHAAILPPSLPIQPGTARPCHGSASTPSRDPKCTAHLGRRTGFHLGPLPTLACLHETPGVTLYHRPARRPLRPRFLPGTSMREGGRDRISKGQSPVETRDTTRFLLCSCSGRRKQEKRPAWQPPNQACWNP